MITMLLVLWHGAKLDLRHLGGLHGLYLMVNHGWRTLRERFPGTTLQPVSTALAVLTTFLFVVIAWVFFRATSLDAALRILQGMFSLQELVLPIEWQPALAAWLPADSERCASASRCLGGTRQLAWIAVLLAMAWTCPNSQNTHTSFSRRCRPCKREAGVWPGSRWALCCAGRPACHRQRHTRVSEFIYFNF